MLLFIALHCFKGNGNSTQTLLTQQHLPEQKYEHCLECTQKIADIKIREDPLIMKNISLVREAQSQKHTFYCFIQNNVKNTRDESSKSLRRKFLSTTHLWFLFLVLSFLILYFILSPILSYSIKYFSLLTASNLHTFLIHQISHTQHKTHNCPSPLPVSTHTHTFLHIPILRSLTAEPFGMEHQDHTGTSEQMPLTSGIQNRKVAGAQSCSQLLALHCKACQLPYTCLSPAGKRVPLLLPKNDDSSLSLKEMCNFVT